MDRRHFFALMMSSATPSFAQSLSAPGGMKPPVAEKIPHVTDLHGDRRVDNYFWMREKSNPKVKAYLDAENAYTDAVMKLTEPLQAQLTKKLLATLKRMNSSLPIRTGTFFITFG